MPIHKQSLTDHWKFYEPAKKKWFAARVPGCIHTDLLRHKLIPDPFWGANERELQWIENRDWVYATHFSVSAAMLNEEHIDLVAEGLDTVTTIVLNGQEVARTENMFIGYRFPIKPLLRAGRNELTIHFTSPLTYIKAHWPDDHFAEWNDPVGGASLIRKEQCSFGWDWGARFATSGIWKSIGLEAWSNNRIESVRVEQTHEKNSVTITAQPQLALKQRGRPRPARDQFRTLISLDGKIVAEAAGLEVTVAKPQLWWPNNMGAQPLYNIEVELLSDGQAIDRWKKEIGLRTIELDRHPDQWGESFQFVVNGVPFFAKGANWIPAHCFVTEVGRDMYDGLLDSAVQANYNMLRVWGGGIYEMDDFYELCDRKGLLVWQDFMFACAQYPGDRHFLAHVEAEAGHQVKRLHHHACLALWCGNNELEFMPAEILKTPQRQKAYDDVFYKLLPKAVAKFDGATAYWPSSPHVPGAYPNPDLNWCDSERAGDCHYWGVWHGREPIKNFESKGHRFFSEFGMQSYCSRDVAETFCPPAELNIYGPAMENHQKNSAGNQIIFDYISRRYRFPKDYASLAYLSQINQAYAMKTAVEHFRRQMPRTMGSLYWQINDCWPVASWSSIEFGGIWKALQYESRRFYAPALITAHVPGDVGPGKINWGSNTIAEVNVHTVYDGMKSVPGTVSWVLYHCDGRILEQASKSVKLKYGQSVLQAKLDFGNRKAQFGASHIYLRLLLEIDGETVSQNTVFFDAPRFIEFERAPIASKIKALSATEFEIVFSSRAFHHQVYFHLPKTTYRASDNYFDLYPGVRHKVRVRLDSPLIPEHFQELLTVVSLVDSY